jgi:hypothetical protein
MDHCFEGADERRTRRCRRIAVAGVGLTAAYWVASLAGVENHILHLFYVLVLLGVLPVTWWAYRSVTGSSKRFVALSVAAVTAHTLGMVLWYIGYLGDTGRALPTLGFWTPALYLALGFEAAATWTVLRDMLRMRDAMLDCSIVVVAAAAIGTAVADQHLATIGWSAATIDTTIRAVLCLVIVTLLASAMLGRGGTLLLSVGLVVAALAAAAGGQIWAAIVQTNQPYTSNRWPDLLWCTATALILLAALTLISRSDRPLRVSRSAVPGISPGPLAVLITASWAAAGVVLVHGLVTTNTYETVVGAAAVAWIAVAAVTRTALALRETRQAYLALDVAHFALEQERERVQELVDERDEVIATLQRRNLELTTTQIMLGPILDLADERSDGELRLRLEETADDLTAWLPLRRDDAQ